MVSEDDDCKRSFKKSGEGGKRRLENVTTTCLWIIRRERVGVVHTRKEVGKGEKKTKNKFGGKLGFVYQVQLQVRGSTITGPL